MRKSVWIEAQPIGYSVRYWVLSGTDPLTRKPIYKPGREYFEDYNLAQKRQAEIKLSLLAKQQGLTDPTLKVVKVFEEYITWCERHPHKRGEYRPATLQLKRDHMKEFVSVHENINDITEKAIVRFENTMHEKKLSLTTIKIRLSEIRAFLNWCVKVVGYLPTSPFKLQVRIPKTPRRKIPLAELKLLEEYMDPKALVYFALLSEHGSRRTETRLVRGENISLKDRIWTIPAVDSKGRKDRVIPLSETSFTALTRHYGETVPHGPLFPGWVEHTPNHFFAKALKRIKAEGKSIGHITPHLLRHTRASNWRGSTYALMDYMGWSSWEMGKLYTHNNIEDLRREAEKE